VLLGLAGGVVVLFGVGVALLARHRRNARRDLVEPLESISTF
jgi:hypothetical protein